VYAAENSALVASQVAKVRVANPSTAQKFHSLCIASQEAGGGRDQDDTVPSVPASCLLALRRPDLSLAQKHLPVPALESY
jgi:hypothetical protein